MTIPANVISAGTCGVMSALNANTAFSGITSMVSGINSTITAIGTAASALLALPSQVVGILLADVQTAVNAIQAAATGAMNDLIGHALGAATSLVKDLSLAIGQASAQAGLTGSGCALPSLGTSGAQSGECGNMDSLFGSISGLGNTLMATAAGAVNQIISQAAGLAGGSITGISSALSTITSAANSVTSAATQITSMIATEVAGKLAMVTDMISFGAASALKNLFNHPCGGPVISAVGSAGLLTSLNL